MHYLNLSRKWNEANQLVVGINVVDNLQQLNRLAGGVIGPSDLNRLDEAAKVVCMGLGVDGDTELEQQLQVAMRKIIKRDKLMTKLFGEDETETPRVEVTYGYVPPVDEYPEYPIEDEYDFDDTYSAIDDPDDEYYNS